MKLLITGGCGFLGSNLAATAIEKGLDVIIFDNLSRTGSIDNLKWLRTLGNITYINGDIRNRNDISETLKNYKPDMIFHLAGQVAMTTSISNPIMDFEINALGTFNLLESVRKIIPQCKVIYSSTNKVYGDLEQFNYKETQTRYECLEMPNGFDENVQLSFHSPYGCSKGTADQYMLDYARIYGLHTVVFRHSSMYGGRQFATYDQGWVGWFCQKAVEASRGNQIEFTISGNGKQVRDVLHANDIISLYFSALDKFEFVSGKAFNIGGGYKQSLSLLELFEILENISNTKLNYKNIAPRESDQRVFIADTTKISSALDWNTKIENKQGINDMYEWSQSILKNR